MPNIVIKPAWQEYDNVDNKIIIEIDSDISFGTGSHETTRTCAELLKVYSESMDLDKVTCLDIGTGTGILLLVAAQLGIKHLVGIDIEEYAANQAKINCENNEVHAEIICGNLDTDFEEMDQLYTSLGIIHLFALSGMQVGFFINGIRKALLRLGILQETVDIWMVPISLVYAGLTGFQFQWFAVSCRRFSLKRASEGWRIWR